MQGVHSLSTTMGVRTAATGGLVGCGPLETPLARRRALRAASCLLSQGGHSRPTTLGVRDPP
jgi:hypothetical protein